MLARATLMLVCLYLFQGRRLVDRKVIFRYVYFKGKVFYVACIELIEFGPG
jgi:hypothetical protein